jgi:two-component system, chemotaxis family, sensor kinase CheA
MLNIYLEEAKELLGKLETCLLELSESGSQKNQVEEIFRIMHTLKGNSSMFGLDKVAQFIHNLESLYDKIRTGKLNISKEIITITFKSLDHIKNIINDPDLLQAENFNNSAAYSKTILALQNEGESQITQTAVLPQTLPDVTGEATFYIYFNPEADLFQNGSNPLLLINELASLGNVKVIPGFKEIQPLSSYNPKYCYSFWEIIVATKLPIEQIKEVFLFVESSAELNIKQLANTNLLDRPFFVTQLNNLPLYTNKLIGFEKIEAFFTLDESDTTVQVTPLSPKTIYTEEAVATSKTETTKPTKKEKSVTSIRVSSDKLDNLMSIVSELVTTQASLTLFAEKRKNAELDVITENVTKLSRRLRDVALGMTLIPIKQLMNRFQRLVRELATDLNKEVELVIEGDETELDKNIIETLSDPIMHILRNSLDHGLESAEERLKKGKSAKGRILFKAYYSGANVHIQIKDDGKGLNPELLRTSAIKKGLITETDILTEKEIFELILQPGFSTASKVTDISGRGVGMDVVKRNITDIRGEIEIASKLNQETSFTIILPLTLSIIDGLLVQIDGENFIVPLTVVDKCYEVHAADLRNNFNRLLILEGNQIPFLNLREKFNLKSELPEISQIIVVNNGDKKIGITVDSIVGEYQAVLKPLGKYYKSQDYISGATILGDGTVALVFDTNKIINQFSPQVNELAI